ncbi:hypothetical protein CDD82_1761 [Ophiocordyceps australis]|uniref:Ecp2 effector protein-like domain-containing protein n=1 Tax=Ophiocordyceps australis TaxID=1399860 RepID=A0A2C5ZEQ1_9HYPO|nr:hypothetical protein CDD82_1761 [Ophiocordyceps australis]
MALFAFYLCLVLFVESTLVAAFPTPTYTMRRRQSCPLPFANATSLWWEPSTDAATTCDEASYADDPKLDAANWRQCAALYSSLAGQNGSFHLSHGNNGAAVPLLSQRDCILSVLPLDADKGPYTIGMRDAEAMLGNSLRNYSRGTLLSVKGLVKCDVAGGGRAGLSWQISKSVE